MKGADDMKESRTKGRSAKATATQDLRKALDSFTESQEAADVRLALEAMRSASLVNRGAVMRFLGRPGYSRMVDET